MPDLDFRIALVRARYTPFGGAERFVQRALTALGDRGANVTVLARQWVGAAPAQDASVRWIRCNPFYLGSIWRDASFARAVRARLATDTFQLVQSHERIAGLQIYRAGDGVHAAWLQRRAALMGFWARLGMRLNPHHAYLKRVERDMFEHPALRAVICNSHMVRDEIATRFRIDSAKLVVIPNGVDLQQFSPKRDMQARLSHRVDLGIAADVPVFVLVGSGFARKGVRFAIEALVGARRQAHLVVVGLDKRLHRYRAFAHARGVGARVHFVGAQRDPTPFYEMADALVLPSIYDPFPNAVLEALACGLPVLISDGCGATDIVVEGQNGWIVPVGDQAALTRAMDVMSLTLLQADATMALRGAARASVEPFSIDALGEALVRFYRGVNDLGSQVATQC